MKNAHPSSTIVATVVVVVALLLSGPPAAAEEGGTTLGDALTKGKFSLNLQYRFEAVDQPDLFDAKGYASTLRSGLAYRTLDWHGVSAFVEAEDVRDVGYGSSHNNKGAGSLWNGVSDRPVIADPELTEINQGYLRLTCPRGLRLQLGRQEVDLGNQRFVGTVGWRQNHQAFDALRFDVTAPEATTFTYAYVGRTRRIFGDSKPMGTHLMEVEHGFGDVGTLRAYGYLLDYDNEADFGLSTSTYGLSFGGSTPLGATKLIYRAELGQQRDAGNNPNDVDAGYRRADLGLSFGKLTVKAGYELLEGEAGSGAFSTPLATLHGFNGWADIFLVTPSEGLQDLFLSVEAALEIAKLAVIWHRFTADSTSADYGSELDALAVFTLPWKQKVGLKLALYSADYYAVDTDKLMIWTSWGF
jgi:hypothetical protein